MHLRLPSALHARRGVDDNGTVHRGVTRRTEIFRILFQFSQNVVVGDASYNGCVMLLMAALQAAVAAYIWWLCNSLERSFDSISSVRLMDGQYSMLLLY